MNSIGLNTKIYILLLGFTGVLFCSSPPDSLTLSEDSFESSVDNLIDKEEITGVFNSQPLRPIKNLAITGINDTWALLKSPFNWDSTSFLIYPSIALTTYFLMILDKPITYNMLADKKYAESEIFKFAEIYGRASTSQYAAACFTAAGMVLQDKGMVRMGIEIFESYFFSNNINSIMKRIFGRTRPSEDEGSLAFNPFPDRRNPMNAFPSGHATLSVSLSTVLAAHTDNFFLKTLAFVPAFLTCFSRVYQNYHWASDVFLGAAIGYLTGTFVVNRHKIEEQDFFSVGLDEQGRVSFIIPLK